MKLSFRLKRVCGSVFSNGNIIFTPDGNSVVSPVGNRVNVFDLVEQSTTTLPFENKKNIKICAISNSGRFLITIDVEGHALFINFPRRVVLQRFHFKRKVYDIKFAPNDEYFAITFGHGCQIWKTPSIQREFAPLSLSRTISGHSDDTVCLDWSADSCSLIVGSKDLSSRIYYRVTSKHMSTSVLSGHRDVLVGTFFAKDNDSAYSVARDGAVFTWTFEYGERTIVQARKISKRSKQNHHGDDDSNDESVDDSDEGENEHSEPKTVRGGQWKLKDREFLWDPHTQVASVAYNKTNSLLVIGFDKGVFGLYEMPGCVNIHRLSVSHHSLNTATINCTGEWLALGSSHLGQLLIWEWQSETYVLKQQGHLYGLNSVDFSADGQYIATAGEDSKVKLWSTSSGFCVVTFNDHIAPVTGVKFIGKGSGKAVISSSLDGSIRAHDLLRYKNFRTLTTATPVQFTCVSADPSGEVICAGALDPFQIYVWALQTGRLLDVLSGHEGPIACLDFSPSGSVLASGSWDGTLKMWDVYKNECIDTFEHGCDVLGVAFRPDGQEVCTSATNGQLFFWEVETGSQVRIIEGRRDISGGRLSTDAVTAQNAARSKHFTSVAYTPDGSCVLAGGHSKYTCIYSVASGSLIKKYQLSHNRSLDGMSEELRSDRLVDGVALDNIPAGDMQDSDGELKLGSGLPGASGKGRGQAGGAGAGDGSRTTRPQILTAAVRFSPTGREWAAATTQGLQIFSLDDTMLFAPTELDTGVTPQAVAACIAQCEFGRALSMALQLSLSEVDVLKSAVDAVPIESIDLVIKSVDIRMLRVLLRFLAEQLSSSRHVEFYLQWCWQALKVYGPTLQLDPGNSMAHREGLRALIRAISAHEREAMRMADDNHFSLLFLCSQLSDQAAASGDDAVEESEGRGAKGLAKSSEQLLQEEEEEDLPFDPADLTEMAAWAGAGSGPSTKAKKVSRSSKLKSGAAAVPVASWLSSATSFFGGAGSLVPLEALDVVNAVGAGSDVDDSAEEGISGRGGAEGGEGEVPELEFSFDRRGDSQGTEVGERADEAGSSGGDRDSRASAAKAKKTKLKDRKKKRSIEANSIGEGDGAGGAVVADSELALAPVNDHGFVSPDKSFTDTSASKKKKKKLKGKAFFEE